MNYNLLSKAITGSLISLRTGFKEWVRQFKKKGEGKFFGMNGVAEHHYFTSSKLRQMLKLLLENIFR